VRILLIAAGGAIGSVLRYLLATFAQHHTSAATARWFGHALPIGTLAVNVVGCLLIGVLAALFARHAGPHEEYRLALTVGVLGGFTAFGMDTFSLMERGHWWLAIGNVVVSCAAGIAAVAAGYFVTEWIG
jgi:fluoride exporter